MSTPAFDEFGQVRRVLLRADAMHPEFELLGIGMQNFQSIREPQFVPFAPLTLLYGPNSAGKSSIADAMTLLTHCSELNTGTVHSMLEKWANRHRKSLASTSGFVDDTSATAIWAFLAASSDGVGDFIAGFERAGELRQAMRNEPIALRLSMTPGEYGQFEYTSVAIWLGSEHPVPLLELTAKYHQTFGYDENNNEYFEWERRSSMRLNTSHPRCAELSQWLSIVTPFATQASVGQFARQLTDAAQTSIALPVTWDEGLAGFTCTSDVSAALRETLVPVLSSVLRLVSTDVAAANRLRVVAPIREVPSERESSFVVLSLGAADRGPRALRFNEATADTPKDPWEEIAESACGRWSPETPRHLWGRSLLQELEASDESVEPELLTYVNNVFRQESLLGLDYELVANRYTFHSAAGTVTSRSGRERAVEPKRKGDVVRLYLLDELGAEVALEDVGTGISQLVPILVALRSMRSVIVHQPELHLHPRLQSSFGDVFVERMASRRHLLTLVESHSEHLLLRVLRRIRETGTDGLECPPYCIRHDQISVLYFDREAGAPTRVVELRLGEDGNFLDRWPHGFFTERDDDLGLSNV